MNREIKFRAWDKKSKSFYFCLSGIGLDDTPINIEVTSSLGDVLIVPIDEVELMQYTGLKDKNGREIYEGDYIYCRDALCEGYSFEGVVKFQSGSFMVKSDIDSHYRWADYETEVTGDIFSNPELKEGI